MQSGIPFHQALSQLLRPAAGVQPQYSASPYNPSVHGGGERTPMPLRPGMNPSWLGGGPQAALPDIRVQSPPQGGGGLPGFADILARAQALGGEGSGPVISRPDVGPGSVGSILEQLRRRAGG